MPTVFVRSAATCDDIGLPPAQGEPDRAWAHLRNALVIYGKNFGADHGDARCSLAAGDLPRMPV